MSGLVHHVRPAAGEPEGLLCLFHGRGGDENRLAPLLDALDPERRLLGVAPRGPLTLPSAGARWYAVRRAGYPDPSTFLEAYGRGCAWLDGLQAKTGIPPERTILGGFSQGAVMSYAFGLARGRPRPAAIVALSGFLPTVEGFQLDLVPPLPAVAIGHGLHDPVIDVGFARAARDLLAGAGADVLYCESPIAHAVDPAFLADIAVWLGRATAAPVEA